MRHPYGYGKKQTSKETRRAYFGEAIALLKSKPYDSSSNDIVYLFEHSQNFDQKKFLQQIVDSFIEIEVVEKVVDSYDSDGWGEISRTHVSTSYKSYNIPSSTRQELRDARNRLMKANTPAYNTDEYKNAQNQRNLNDNFKKLF